MPRMQEYVEALRAIWRWWEKGEPLGYEGNHYRLTLMTPEFSPRPTGLPPIPVTIAAVGPDMLGMAGRVCDGVRLHGFCTRRYIEEVALPRIQEGLAASARSRARFEIWGGGFIATGPDEGAVRGGLDEIRRRVAFYGSTRSYRHVFELHGLGASRVWLHTCNLDSPKGLKNYVARGFEVYKVERMPALLPIESPGPWPESGVKKRLLGETDDDAGY